MLSTLGCFFLMFNSWGIVNAYGTFLSFYQETLLPETSFTYLSLIGSTQCFLVLLMSGPVGRLLDANHSMPLKLVGSLLTTLGLLLLSVVNIEGKYGQGSWIYTWLTQGLVVGFGMSCFFVSSSQIASTWFQRKKAFAIGVVASGASISGVVYPFMVRFCVTRFGFVTAVRYASCLLGGTNLLAIVLACPNPKHSFHRPESWFRKEAWIDVSAFRNRQFRWFTVAICFMFFGFYGIFFSVEAWSENTRVGHRGPWPPGRRTSLPTYYLLAT